MFGAPIGSFFKSVMESEGGDGKSIQSDDRRLIFDDGLAGVQQKALRKAGIFRLA
jgi:hypothetical protein